MTTDVQKSAAEYMAHGWKLCLISPGGKGPTYKNWNVAGQEILDPSQLPIGHGVGLLHAFSGTMALDIDNYPVAKQWLDEQYGVDLDALMGADDAVQISSGKENSAKLLYRLPAPRVSQGCAPFQGEDRNGNPITKLALDFRCASATGNSVQDALPPTVHPGRGRPYIWVFGPFGSWQDIPTIPPELAAVWDILARPLAESANTVAVATGAAQGEIKRWLATQDAGMTRSDWVKVGMKLHAEFQGDMRGYAIWQEWSSTHPKFDDEARASMHGIWRGFKLEGRALATLETDLRTLPAEPESFPEVEQADDLVGDISAPEFTVPRVVERAGEAVSDSAYEPAFVRETRELMEEYIVMQTGGAKPYFLRPGHPIEELRIAAGLAGVEIGERTLGNLFGPYLPPWPVGKTVAQPDPVDVIKRAKWRKTVHRMAFRPGGQEAYVSDDGHRYLNAYKAIPIEPIKPRHHEIEPLEWLLRRVLDDHNKPTGGVFSQWLVRLYAFCLKNPGVKVKWAPLLYSAEQGTGKTTLMETLPALLYGRQYVKPMVHSILRERFAGAKFDSTWWVALSEMRSDAGKVDAKAIANKLKPWITDDTIPIEKKGVDQFEIKNYLQLTACSNHEDALYIDEGSTDRRWLIGEMLGQALSVEEMAMLNPLFGSDFVRDPNAVNWLHWYFLNAVDLSGFNPAEPPPETMAKTRVREQSRSHWEDMIHYAFDNGTAPFDKDLIQPTDITQGLLIGNRVTSGQAMTLLRSVGCKELPGRFNFARHVFACRHFEQWSKASMGEVRQHFHTGARPFTLVDDAADLL